MAYDENLANRIRQLVGSESDLTEKKMFGGLAFLIGGNLAVAASGQDGILVRVTLRSQTRSSRRPKLTTWKCAGGECRGGYESTRKMFAANASSPSVWISARRTPARCLRSDRPEVAWPVTSLAGTPPGV
jgi:hypothetical protein